VDTTYICVYSMGMNNTLAEKLMANTRITPIAKGNQVKRVMKLENGDLQVEQHSGNVFVIKQEDEMFQAFVVYTVLADL
jgi:hypothetical protein